MLPALPSQTTPEVDDLLVRVIAGSAALGKGIHPLILAEVARLMLKVNSYYTNAMEGNPSRLKDIDAALADRLFKDKTARNHQLEHLAHIKVQDEMLARLRREPGLRVCSEDFLCWLHARFFEELPAERRVAQTLSGRLVPVEPGRLRDRGVTVGRHSGPETIEEVRSHLRRFDEMLGPEALAGPRRLLGMAASHHRLLWIHPFPEGNGRVARLLTAAYGFRIGVGADMLWTVSRAFARERADYDAHLAAADLPRRNDLDGRGPLSEEELLGFCAYFLRCCDDQIGFMDGALKLSGLRSRALRHVDGLIDDGALSRPAHRIFDRLLSDGEVPRSSIKRLCAVKARRASQLSAELLAAGVARSETPYGPLRLNITAEFSALLFPELT